MFNYTSVIKNFYDLKVWQKATDLTVEIYAITDKFPKKEIFRLSSQLERASSSVGANIAESFGKYYKKDRVKYLHQARGSLLEVQNFLLLIRRLGYITNQEFEKMFNEHEGLAKGINVYISALNEKLER